MAAAETAVAAIISLWKDSEKVRCTAARCSSDSVPASWPRVACCPRLKIPDKISFDFVFRMIVEVEIPKLPPRIRNWPNIPCAGAVYDFDSQHHDEDSDKDSGIQKAHHNPQ